jgi:hypothetical protein
VWTWIVIGVVVLALIGSAIGSSSSDSTTSSSVGAATSTATVLTTTTAETAAVTTSPSSSQAAVTTVAPTTAAPAPTAAPTTQPAPTTTSLPGFGSGTKLVNTDVAPGRYLSLSAGGNCYWARLKDASGDFEAILANDNTRGQAIVEIAPTDGVFESSGCARWQLYAPPPAPVTTFGEGTWVVNEQIVPGRYRSSGDSGSCYWQRQSGFGGDFGEILANANTEGPAVVDISPSDAGFKSSGCGTWSTA